MNKQLSVEGNHPGNLQEVLANTSVGLVNLINKFEVKDIMPVMFRLIAEGNPVSLERLADHSGLSVQVVKAKFSELKAEWDERGRLVGLGLTLNKTPHRLIINGHTLFAWCASDTLIFVHVLGSPARIESICPATGKMIAIEAGPDQIKSIEPGQAVVSGLVPDCSPSDVREKICQFGNFFSSAEAASEWLTLHPEGRVVPVAREFEICHQIARSLGWV